MSYIGELVEILGHIIIIFDRSSESQGEKGVT